MANGDAVNSTYIRCPAHSGTHVDAPRHFDAEGVSIDHFEASWWHCTKPWLIEINACKGEIINFSLLGEALENTPVDMDLLLIKTGFERHRIANDSQEIYTCHGPGISPEIGVWLRRNRRIKMIGFDFISLSSYDHRELGRVAHRAFLVGVSEPPILIIEDMHLAELTSNPNEVWVVPLRLSDGDGAPATIISLGK
jgi:kynurenine formamidase